MRLLNVHTFDLQTFYGDSIPPYTILSHTWLETKDEVTFVQLQNDTRWREILGARKIEYVCKQAAADDFNWAWVDTCCIDKANSSELSEAINSMFRWYQEAEVCYVYLVDVDYENGQDFLDSRWWNRAWTLQELVAPSRVQFFDEHWRPLGFKHDLSDKISARIGIDPDVLRDASAIPLKSVATRMSWAAHRQATRAEDLAYALLGIFDINITMQYGEGDKAFVRLQREIMRTTNDLSLLAWNFAPQSPGQIACCETNSGYPYKPNLTNNMKKIVDADFFAPLPSCFAGSRDIHFLDLFAGNTRIEERNGMLKLSAPIVRARTVDGTLGFPAEYHLAFLPCTVKGAPFSVLALLFRHFDPMPGRDYHNWDSTSAHNFRSIRCMFSEGLSTALVQSEWLEKAKVQEVDLYPSVVTFQQLVRRIEDHSIQTSISNLIQQTLLVDFCNFKREYEFEVQSNTGWRRDSVRMNCFRLDPQKTKSSRTVVRILNGSSTLYIEFGIYDRRCPSLLMKKSAQTREETELALSELDKLRSMDWRPVEDRKPNMARLSVKQETSYVFKQGITTLTIERMGALAKGDKPYPRHGVLYVLGRDWPKA